jgi:hypothetical protein
MNTTEDRLRRATRAAADTVAPGSAPPLHLPSMPGRRRWPGWVTPLAAAAAAAGVIVALAGIGGIVRALQGPQLSLSSAPPYYLALIPNGNNGPQYAVIRSTVTGATEATIRPPKPFNTFSQATGAADDRTFVLGAQSFPAGWTGPAGGKPPVKFFVVHFSPAHGTFTMAPLPIPEIGNTVQGIALSPDATRLAITNDTDPTGAETQVRIYSLASGAVRVWQSPGTIGNGGGDDQDAMSWAADGETLAFNWTPATKHMKNGELCFTSVSGVLWLLNTATAGGSLLADSRLALPTSLPSGVGSDNQATLTPDGTKIIIPVQRPGRTISAPCLKPVPFQQVLPHQAGASAAPSSITFEFEVFSTRTGKLVDALHPDHVRNGSSYPDLSMAWSNPSGSVLVVQAPTGNGRPAVLGVLSGDKFIPIPGTGGKPIPGIGGSPQLVF